MSQRNDQLKLASSTAPFTASAGQITAVNYSNGQHVITTAGGVYGYITLAWVPGNNRWEATSSLGGYTWTAPSVTPGQYDAPITTFTTTGAQGTFTMSAADTAPQVDFQRSFAAFSLGTDYRTWEAQVSVPPALLNRRIWADIRKNPGATENFDWTITLLLRSVVVGVIPHRTYYSEPPASMSGDYWTLSPEFGRSGNSTLQDTGLFGGNRRVDGSLLVHLNDGVSGGYPGQLAPIPLVVQCDTIRVACTAWVASGPPATNLRVLLACLSSAHKL